MISLNCSNSTSIFNIFSLHNPKVDCEWGAFGEWGGCTQTCGEGIQTRTRTMVKVARFGGQLCTGYSTESKSCNLQLCPGKYHITMKNHQM